MFHAWLPELATLAWPEEERATCSKCAMVAWSDGPPVPEGVRTFRDDARCCTYHPTLPNYAVGALLSEGGEAARLVKARMVRTAEGIELRGIEPGPTWERAYDGRDVHDFGQRLAFLCPYFVGGAEACGVWRHRNAVCRTWFCKLTDGKRGWEQWEAAREALDLLERAVATWVVQQHRPRHRPRSPKQWERWYRDCASHVWDMDPAALTDVAHLSGVRDHLVDAEAARLAAMPEVLVPTVRAFDRRGETTLIAGYSVYDVHAVPSTVFLLLAGLDGKRAWRDAVALARDAGATWVDEDAVRHLFRMGVLGGQEEMIEPPPVHQR